MIRYYFVLFFRNIRRQKLFSFINLLGLSAGIVSSLLIYLYINDQFSYDTFHTNGKNIYRINQTFIWGENDDHQFASLGPGVGYAIGADIPEAKEVTRVHPTGNYLVTYAGNKNDIKSFDEESILAVDSNFFDVFTFPLVKGNPRTALTKPQSVVLSETTAKWYFGDDEPLGKLLQFGEGEKAKTCEVTGIMKDMPNNSYIESNILMSMNSFPEIIGANELWLWTTFETFVLLDERTSPEVLQTKINVLPRKYAGPTLERAFDQTFDQYEASGKKWELFVQPFTSIHLHSSNVYNRINVTGNIKIVYVLMGVEAFIILLSCINFMNLSTAQYTRRIKESSLRKILGSDRNQLALHFFLEAFMFCCIAALIGLGLTQLVMPYFNVLAGTNLSLDLFHSPNIVLMLAGLIVFMSLLSGSYPAIFLSRFSAVEAMKGKLRTGKQGMTLRNGLVTFQFAISTTLIVCTIVVFQQLQYLGQKDIGFNRENLMVISRVEWVNDKETFRHALENIPGIDEATWCTSVPPDLYDGDQFRVEGSHDKLTPLNYVKTDEQYVATLGLDLKVGRNFSKDIPGDANRVILNETAVKAFGWTVDDNVIGKKIEYPNQGTFEVIGVVRDFNYWSLHTPIQPMAIFHIKGDIFSSNYQFMALRVTPGSNTEKLKAMIAGAETSWKKFAGDRPFDYSFVNESFDRQFSSEEKFSHGLIIFASLAIIIACLGLLGMIIYTLEQRLKEIGIRKVVGASVAGIWLMMIRNYVYLILIAFSLSVPVCMWLLNNWLEDFNYRIELSPAAFVIAGGLVLITSLIVTSYHVLKAARTNPVDVLKDE